MQEDHLDTIRYEINMLDFTCAALKDRRNTEERGDFQRVLGVLLAPLSKPD